ncbi:hypothetical protein [Enterococcus faecalis]|uniref:hypothetical protein n=1 Tax=Enterococcus faecalis TaxID=1351 RepID=UPI001F04852C|nr:hypothetical protein [Enterococcus faecalis]
MYDSKTDTLDERGLIHASRAMMKELMEKKNYQTSRNGWRQFTETPSTFTLL